MDISNIFYAKTDVTHGRGYVYCLQYHIVWVTKYRKPVLTGPVETDLKRLLTEIASDLDIHIDAMETMPDHVHLLIETKPQCRLSDAIKVFKGTSAWHLFQLHPELKHSLWGGHMWNTSYFVVTVSDRSFEQAEAYIESQKTRPGIGGRPRKY